jgi:hypothetical protein
VAHNSADCTGIGGHSCARHGCFAPGSLVNFQKGEKQMNMDWSLCEALATTNIGLIKLLLHIYDISCQYCQHLKTRVERNDLLNIPGHLTLLHAIGLFHIHGPKMSAFTDGRQTMYLVLGSLTEKFLRPYGPFSTQSQLPQGPLPLHTAQKSLTIT